MAIQNLLEKIQFTDEKNVLIQGLPSSVEKQFIKLSFAKNVTPLLRSRKIEFALVFAVSQKQLTEILKDVIPALHDQAKLWIAYPKSTSKIASDLSRDANWHFIDPFGYRIVRSVAIDHVWSAVRCKKNLEDEMEEEIINGFSSSNPAPGVDYETRTIEVPVELEILLSSSKPANAFFESLSFTNKREYVEWILSAKKDETKNKRLEETIYKLNMGKKNPSEK
jgi:hypothetical protein